MVRLSSASTGFVSKTISASGGLWCVGIAAGSARADAGAAIWRRFCFADLLGRALSIPSLGVLHYVSKPLIIGPAFLVRFTAKGLKTFTFVRTFQPHP